MPDSNIGLAADGRLGVQIVHHCLDPVFLTTPDGGILYANPAACKLFGYTDDEFIAGGRDLIMDNDDPEVAALVANRDADGFVRGEQWMKCRDGRRIRMEVSSSLFEDDDGETRSAIIARDISRQRRHEYEHLVLGAAAKGAPLVVCVTDEEWRILWANEGTERISGYPLQDLTGHPAPMRRYLEESMPEVLAAIKQKLETSGSWTGQVYTRRKDGEVYPLYGTISVIEIPGSGKRQYVAALADVSRLREFERRLHDLSLYDPVTGLPNRSLFEHKFQKILGHPDSRSASILLFLIEIDEFAVINEILGHETGDLVLKEVAERLNDANEGRFILARYTGDSFALLTTSVKGLGNVASLVDRLRLALQAPLTSGEHRLALSASIGISSYPQDGGTPGELLKNAKIAQRGVKRQGGNDYAFYQPGSDSKSRRYIELAAPMREALSKGEFEAHFQPIVDSGSLKTVGMEVLARWKRADGTSVSPADFIPVAERTGMISALSEALMHQACRHLKALDGTDCGDLRASINLSAKQLHHPDLAERILAIASEEGIAPDRLSIEITESQLMHHPEQKSRILDTLQDHGIRVVIDDFGTGYSSLAYLKHFKVDGIKLDRLFIRDIPGDVRAEKLVVMIMDVGRNLEIPMVAEGVETEAQAVFLRRHGCERLQGYLFAPAMSSSDFRSYLLKMGQSGGS